MKQIKARLIRLEERLTLKVKKGEPEPLGVALGCPPETFIDWYDHCLHLDSKWHTLSFQQKYEAVFKFNYKPGYDLPEFAKGLTTEFFDCNIALFRVEERARRRAKPGLNDFEYAELTNEEKEAYQREWQEQEEKLKGSIP